MKKTKIIIPAMGMLLLGTAASVTGTVAWFSMNNSASITGMQVTTKVQSNLFIAADTTANTAKLGDSLFGNSLNQAVSGVLEPVSTVDGLNYYYTASSNVKPDGDAIEEKYIAYDRSSAAGKNAFDKNYGFVYDDGDEDCVGYIDYAFQLKAVNTDLTYAQAINLEVLNLAYKGTDSFSGINAFRVAVFVEQYNKKSNGETHTANVFHAIGTNDGAGTPVNWGTTTILVNSGAENQTAAKAVNGTTSLGDVSYSGFSPIAVGAGETAYYKVVVRLWIEGEDKKCTNETFAELDEKWELDLEWRLVSGAGSAKSNITNSEYALYASSYTVEFASPVTISTTKYYKITGLTYDGAQVYTTQEITADTPLALDAELFTIAGVGGESPVATDVSTHFVLK